MVNQDKGKKVKTPSIFKGMGIGFSVLITVIAILTGMNQFVSWIDIRIDNRIREPKYMTELSSLVRPSIIVHQDGHWEDMGGDDFIEDIKIEFQIPITIKVIPKRPLKRAPILTSLDEEFAISVKPGDKYSWVYTLKSLHGIANIMGVKTRKPNPNKRFRIEIID